jgi:23S rRNA (guanosine2251-2'-O)-methyltransferase
MKTPELVLIVHNVRSTHNVGSILRSADGFGAGKVYLTGYTPYPKKADDERLPHLAVKIDRQIHKTALGAEETVEWCYQSKIEELINELKKNGFLVAALEQTPTATLLNKFLPDKKIALIVGNEIDGLDQKTLRLCDAYLQIPMRGSKESFNVAVAAAVAMYQLTLDKN